MHDLITGIVIGLVVGIIIGGWAVISLLGQVAEEMEEERLKKLQGVGDKCTGDCCHEK